MGGMALTHTIAGLRTALATYNTAFAAALGAHPANALWDTARSALNAYAATYAGLPSQFETEGLKSAFPGPADLRKGLEAAIQHEYRSAAKDNRRLIRAGVRFGS